MAITSPLVIWSCLMCLTISNWAALGLGIVKSAIFFSCKQTQDQGVGFDHIISLIPSKISWDSSVTTNFSQCVLFVVSSRHQSEGLIINIILVSQGWMCIYQFSHISGINNDSKPHKPFLKVYLCVKFFEEIFKEQWEQLTSQLKTFVSDIISVINISGITSSEDNSTHHQSYITTLNLEVPVLNLKQNHTHTRGWLWEYLEVEEEKETKLRLLRYKYYSKSILRLISLNFDVMRIDLYTCISDSLSLENIDLRPNKIWGVRTVDNSLWL